MAMDIGPLVYTRNMYIYIYMCVCVCACIYMHSFGCRLHKMHGWMNYVDFEFKNHCNRNYIKDERTTEYHVYVYC